MCCDQKPPVVPTCFGCGLPVEEHTYDELKEHMAVPLDPALMAPRVEPPSPN